MRTEEEKLNRAGVLINEFPWQSLNYAAIAEITKSRGSQAPGSQHPLKGALLCGAGGGECWHRAAHHRAVRAGQSLRLGLCMGWLRAKGKGLRCEPWRHGNHGSKQIYPVGLSKGL